MRIEIERLGDGPIIRPDMDSRMGDNVNGPALIKVPRWVPRPLGRYYLYFGHHDGRYIRLAYANDPTGPWAIHEPGVLPIEQSLFAGHIASPDAIVDHEAGRIHLYFHGADKPTGEKAPQFTRVATSVDGIHFETRDECLGAPYMRTVRHRDWYYSIAMPGHFYRSRDGLSRFERGPTLFDPEMRHAALLVRGDTLLVFYTQVSDVPERILLSEIDLSRDWWRWQNSSPTVVLEPERDYEGANLPLRPSVRGLAPTPVRELRDPAVYADGDDLFLLYSVAGERGIAIARMRLSMD
ncbi:MAG: hypothetical protein KDK91_03085 [Gammaproteobacteria bacterium]|nr:hypothetical protein [Gammaproteobacteria bacterium]